MLQHKLIASASNDQANLQLFIADLKRQMTKALTKDQWSVFGLFNNTRVAITTKDTSEHITKAYPFVEEIRETKGTPLEAYLKKLILFPRPHHELVVGYLHREIPIKGSKEFLKIHITILMEDNTNLKDLADKLPKPLANKAFENIKDLSRLSDEEFFGLN